MENQPKNKLVDLIFGNTQIIILLSLFLLVAGVSSLLGLKREGFPSVTLNIAYITAPFPGANADQVERQLLEPIEAKIEKIKHVAEYESSASNSFGMAIVTFEEGVDLDEHIRTLRTEIDDIKLPDGAEDLKVSKIDITGGLGDFVVGVTGISDPWDLYHQTEEIRKEIKSLKNISDVEVLNPLTSQIVIEFDESALKEKGLTRDQAEEVLKIAQADLPVGSFVDRTGDRINLGLKKEISDLSKLRDIQITPTVRLEDVAHAWVELDNNDYYNRLGYRISDDHSDEMLIERTLLLNIKRKDTADLLRVDNELSEKIEEIKDENNLGSDLEIVPIYSMADFTRSQVGEVQSALFGQWLEDLGGLGFIGYMGGAIFLVLLLLLIFINVRVAVLAALSMPLSIISAAIVLQLLGINLNTLVLFSMILLLGLVVDPTIVFLESIQRYREQGYGGREAVAKTISTVGTGMFLAVLTNILVFVPFGIVSGFFGQIIKYIPLTVIPAMAASLLIPIVLFTPIAAGWLRPRSDQTHRLNEHNSELTGTWHLSKLLGRFIKNLLAPTKGKAVLRFMIVLLATTLPFGVAGILMQSGAIKIVQFASGGDAELIAINGEIPENWSFDKAVYSTVVPLQSILAEQPEIKNFGYYMQQGNSFAIIANLYTSEYRQEEDLRTASDLVDDLNRNFKSLGEKVTITAVADDGGPPEDNYPVSLRFFDQDFDKLRVAATEATEFLGDQDGIIKVTDTLSNNGGSQTGVTLLLDEDHNLNLNPFLSFKTIADQLKENKIGHVEFNNTTYDLVTKMSGEVNSIEDIENIKIALGYGQAVKIKELIKGTEAPQSQTIQRLNGQRYVEVRAKVDDNTDPVKIQQELKDYFDEDKLGDLGLDTKLTESGGIAASMAETFTELFIALAVAMFLIYVLLVVFFRSFLSPLIILFAVPLGFVGVFPAIAATTGQLGFLELLGVVAMAGIVVNVTILIIGFANHLKSQGQDVNNAIATSIAVRFRPILLTQLTAFGSLIPLAFYSPFWRGLAVVIAFGIVVSALLSLITTPILYAWNEAIIRFFHRHQPETHS